jgi:hypothetical protein
MSNDAYSNMAEGDKADLHGLWEDQVDHYFAARSKAEETDMDCIYCKQPISAEEKVFIILRQEEQSCQKCRWEQFCKEVEK